MKVKGMTREQAWHVRHDKHVRRKLRQAWRLYHLRRAK